MKEYIKKFANAAAADGHVIDNPFTTTIVGEGNLVCNEEGKKLVVEGGEIKIVNAGPVALSNNQIKYTANEALTINNDVDYTGHTFKDGVGIVTFNNDLTTLETYWFIDTFDNYADNIISLTLPNGVSSIAIGALNSCGDVYYEGTQKECARIEKDLIDGSSAGSFICFDGIVSDTYQSNIINFSHLLFMSNWVRNLMASLSSETKHFIIGICTDINKHPMTVLQFVKTLVDGTVDIPGLSARGFTVEPKSINGKTCPFAVHKESGHFIGILKAIDYSNAVIDSEYLIFVDFQEDLDPDYMYVLLDDTILN